MSLRDDCNSLRDQFLALASIMDRASYVPQGPRTEALQEQIVIWADFMVQVRNHFDTMYTNASRPADPIVQNAPAPKPRMPMTPVAALSGMSNTTRIPITPAAALSRRESTPPEEAPVMQTLTNMEEQIFPAPSSSQSSRARPSSARSSPYETE